MYGNFKLITLMSGQLFGDDDVKNERCRFATATCISHTGIIRRIEKEEFARRVEAIEDTAFELKKQLYTREMKMKERLDMIEGVYKISPKEIYAAIELEKQSKEKKEAAK